MTSPSQENYSLRWSNHQSHILEAFDALLQQNSLVDVTLVCADRSLRAHKVVLSACSPFFERVFNDTPCKHPVIVLKDFRGWLVQAIVDFMYHGEIAIPQERLSQLIQAGESLQIRGLIGAVPYTIPNSNPSKDRESPQIQRETCVSPMPRRKQARPRRRSGDLTDLPQDLTNGTVITKCEQDDSHTDTDDDEKIRILQNGTDDDDKVHNDDNNNGLNEDDDDDDDVSKDGEEKENQPDGAEQPSEPENLCTKKSNDSQQSPSDVLTIGDKNNNNDGNGSKKRPTIGAPPTPSDFHERFILSLKDLRHLNRYRQGPPPGHPFNDILSHLPISPPPSFQMHHADAKDQHMKMESDHSDAGTPPFPEQMDLSRHSSAVEQFQNAMDKQVREHQKMERHIERQMMERSGMPPGFPPPFQDGQMRGPGNNSGHHPGSPLSFPSMPSVSALTLTPPHMFGLDSPLGLFPPGMDPSKMYNPLMDLPEHHPAHHRSIHDHPPFLKKKLNRPKGQHSAPRGGPPRSWTNAELTEALQHVWNKKMTTSQASRIFGIPYNSLLMYVRGKYGKSLKLEQLRKDCISGPPIELLQMGPTSQAKEKKEKNQQQDNESGERRSGGQDRHGHEGRDHQSGQRRSASSEPDMMVSSSPLFNPFPPGFYPDFPGASGFPGLQLSMLNLLPPEARLHQPMMPMVIDDDCKSDNGSIQSLEDSLPATPINLNRDQNGESNGQSSSAARQLFQN